MGKGNKASKSDSELKMVYTHGKKEIPQIMLLFKKDKEQFLLIEFQFKIFNEKP